MKSLLLAATALIVLGGCAAGQPPAAPSSPSASYVQCQPVSEAQVAALFDRWNQSLQSGDAQQVVANYAEYSILLPTVSNTPRLTPAEKADYFQHFLHNKPRGVIDRRHIETGCNWALDAGLYTFTFATTGQQVKARYSFTWRWDGQQWLISSHHSSAMPER